MTTNIEKIRAEIRSFFLRSALRDDNGITILVPSAKMQKVMKHLKESAGKE